MKKRIDHHWYSLMMVFFIGCSYTNNDADNQHLTQESATSPTTPYITILGIAQDAGYPQIDCEKSCCQPAWEDSRRAKLPTCLGLIDPLEGKSWMFEATPEIKWQWQMLKETSGANVSGIFLTHAHIGHYTGLMHLGREAMGASNLPVFAMPRMMQFLQENGPWDQLITLKNIELIPLDTNSKVAFKRVHIEPLLVPHRDEYSETVGYKIFGPNKKVLFIPDIDKWSKWNESLAAQLTTVDIALIDGSFYQEGELPNRNMAEIPHPFVVESIATLKDLPADEKDKVYFIHLNHTNPLLRENSKEDQEVRMTGMHVAREGQIIVI